MSRLDRLPRSVRCVRQSARKTFCKPRGRCAAQHNQPSVMDVECGSTSIISGSKDAGAWRPGCCPLLTSLHLYIDPNNSSLSAKVQPNFGCRSKAKSSKGRKLSSNERFVRQRQKCFHHALVELFTTLRLDFGQGFREWPRFLIRPLVGKGVENIRDGNDAPY